MDWFLYDRDIRHEELTKLYNKFTESQNQKILISQYRSRSFKVFCKNGVLGSFLKFTRKHLCWNLLLKK